MFLNFGSGGKTKVDPSELAPWLIPPHERRRMQKEDAREKEEANRDAFHTAINRFMSEQ